MARQQKWKTLQHEIAKKCKNLKWKPDFSGFLHQTLADILDPTTHIFYGISQIYYWANFFGRLAQCIGYELMIIFVVSNLQANTKLAQKGQHQTKTPEVPSSILTEGNILLLEFLFH